MTRQPPFPPEGPAGQVVPTCYRHPERETYVRCTRCNRPICPDCMRDAPVGHQCVECVRAANRDIRPARTIFGGRVGTVWVTWVLLAVNVLAYLVERTDQRVVFRFAMVPSLAAAGEWWRMVTSAFLHDPRLLLHILFNMWALWILGPELERRLGAARFATLYLLSALGGSVAVLFLAAPDSATLGASAAIFGLFAAWFVVCRRMGYDTGWITGLIVINLIITVLFSRIISWQGHLGGLVTGAVIAAVFAYAPREQRTAVHTGAALAVFGLFVLLALLRAAQL